ncbi:hypothetical protein EXS45_00985 [Candidatus Nomurabacteria bacterium]|nr:hypothetical protein [Candidatus Nomurabacteria bacterium]
MDEVIDLLKIKIEKARRELPLETVNAIDAVDWKAAILSLRSKYGYTFEQLGDLELETELLLSGLVSGENYPKELETRMKIPKAAVNELVNEMNNLVFRKIQAELIKNTERKNIFQKNSPLPEYPLEGVRRTLPPRSDLDHSTQEEGNKEILPVPEKLELTGEVNPILAQKLSGSFKIPMVKTEHSLENITKTANEVTMFVSQKPKVYPKNADPYRLSPEE